MKKLLILVLIPGSLFAGTIDFNRDVRPILSDTCFKCHGPGETKGDLRLDDREDALDAGVLSPGDAAKSEIVKRLKTADLDELMPPPESNKTLTPKQIQILETWIAEGAEYDDHWSLV
ncbi:MAG: c-type cytochrome domain-containing protein, partial [Akkermansiaceae bacterium]